MKKFYYPKNKHTYTFVDEIRMKLPADGVTAGQWIDAVLYRDTTGAMYAREKEDFYSKFIELKN